MLLTHRLGRTAVRAGSGLALLTVTAGVPTGLVFFIGWPLPHDLPTTWDQIAAILTGGFPDTAVVGLLAVALWLVWASFCHALAVEVAAARRGKSARRIRLISPMQALAALLVAGLAAGPAAASVAIVTPTPALAPYLVEPAASQTGQPVTPLAARTGDHHPAPFVDATPRTPPAAPPASPTSLDGVPTDLPRFALAAHTGPLTVTAAGTPYTVIVQRGDTLWDLAQAWLGDPHRWTEIYQLNSDRYDGNGRIHPGEGRMHGGDHIEPTWQLVLPDDATPPPTAKPDTYIPPATTEPATPPPAGTTPTSPPTTPHTPTPAATAQPPTPAEPTIAPGDDGVVGDNPNQANPSATTSPTPTSGNATTSPSATATADPAPPRTDRPPPGVSLTGDSWVDLGLALAIAAAATVVWRLRRRRYTPRPPSAHTRTDDPDLTPLPDIVTKVRRGLRTATPDTDDSLHDLLDHTVDTDEDDNPIDEDPSTDNDQTDDDLAADGQADEPEPAEPTPLNLPALGNPMLTAWPPAGLGLTGPGAEAAARGFLTTALAAGSIDDPHGRSSVVLPAATLATLLGAAAVNVPDTPRLTVTGNLTETLELLEEQTLHRTRLLYGHEVDTVTQLRDADPHEEPLPPILLLADATVPHERARIAALLAQGQRLDIHGVLLGTWPDGNTVVVAGDGTTSPAEGEGSRHGSHPADIGRLTVITAAETAALLTTLAESHTGLPQPPAPAEQQPHIHATTTGPATPTDHHKPATGPAPDPDTATSPDQLPGVTPGPDTTRAPTVEAHTTSPNSAAAAAARPDGDDDGQDLDDHETDDVTDGPGVVAVQVLGRPTIVGADPDQPLRAKALELLVYLIARDGGATVDAMKEDLVPDATVSKAPHRIHTYVYALRLALKRTGGRATYITHPRHRYLLNRDTLDVDLWRMREALADAGTATGDARIAALRRAVATYHGPFADGTRYEWAEPYREAIRRQALDAHLTLADALRDQPDEALTVLDAAIAHDPYAEQLYQAAMRRHADLNDIDAITARLTELTRRLEELDVEPTDDTSELAATLTDDIRRRARRAPGTAP
ncbi:transcriptional activator [Micromonospora sp. Llam0]|uniref:BTAD domain-containing putative transcriptional regulator n=1 Tax=Micromonospora sp. Llam0 TaxID=2485143 RepID=UPI000F485BFA|nr:BTAD domain-containing putative transcriptional regulator [Micromonospora sp. Llam0]ROO62987.1 transcriptional activator [Micromonospora sp. Llam0]